MSTNTITIIGAIAGILIAMFTGGTFVLAVWDRTAPLWWKRRSIASQMQHHCTIIKRRLGSNDEWILDEVETKCLLTSYGAPTHIGTTSGLFRPLPRGPTSSAINSVITVTMWLLQVPVTTDLADHSDLWRVRSGGRKFSVLSVIEDHERVDAKKILLQISDSDSVYR